MEKDNKRDGLMPAPDNNFGESEVVFHPDGSTEVIEQKSGDVTVNRERRLGSAFDLLDQLEKLEVIKRIEEIKGSGEWAHLTPAQLECELSNKREELAKVILDARK